MQGVRDLADVAAQIPGLLDPAVATVTNLDVVGQLVGQSRVLSSGTEVSDALFRGLIALRIARNASKGTSPELVAALSGRPVPAVPGVAVPVPVLTTWAGCRWGSRPALGRRLMPHTCARW
jgi:hypothetical protein